MSWGSSTSAGRWCAPSGPIRRRRTTRARQAPLPAGRRGVAAASSGGATELGLGLRLGLLLLLLLLLLLFLLTLVLLLLLLLLQQRLLVELLAPLLVASPLEQLPLLTVPLPGLSVDRARQAPLRPPTRSASPPP